MVVAVPAALCYNSSEKIRIYSINSTKNLSFKSQNETQERILKNIKTVTNCFKDGLNHMGVDEATKNGFILASISEFPGLFFADDASVSVAVSFSLCVLFFFVQYGRRCRSDHGTKSQKIKKKTKTTTTKFLRTSSYTLYLWYRCKCIHFELFIFEMLLLSLTLIGTKKSNRFSPILS